MKKWRRKFNKRGCTNPGENTTTFLLVSKHTGLNIIFR